MYVKGVSLGVFPEANNRERESYKSGILFNIQNENVLRKRISVASCISTMLHMYGSLGIINSVTAKSNLSYKNISIGFSKKVDTWEVIKNQSMINRVSGQFGKGEEFMTTQLVSC